MTRKTSCASRWKGEKNGRIRDLRLLLTAWNDGDEDRHANDIGILSEYGLCFDYVAPETFTEQPEGYWRYQLSWGGPSDEFRFYASGCGEHAPYRIAYVFLDWFDGHERALNGNDLEFMRSLWMYFSDSGATRDAYRTAMHGLRS